MFPKNEYVYLDANFVVAYFVGIHTQNIEAGKLMARLLISKNTLCYSPLTLDEALQKIYETLRKKDKAGNFPPHANFYTDLKEIVEKLLAHPQIKIVQFENNLRQGAINAVENIHTYIFRPRDAFHTAYLQDLGIKYIVSNDSSFDRLKPLKIKRLPFGETN